MDGLLSHEDLWILCLRLRVATYEYRIIFAPEQTEKVKRLVPLWLRWQQCLYFTSFVSVCVCVGWLLIHLVVVTSMRELARRCPNVLCPSVLCLLCSSLLRGAWVCCPLSWWNSGRTRLTPKHGHTQNSVSLFCPYPPLWPRVGPEAAQIWCWSIPEPAAERDGVFTSCG